MRSTLRATGEQAFQQHDIHLTRAIQLNRLYRRWRTAGGDHILYCRAVLELIPRMLVTVTYAPWTEIQNTIQAVRYCTGYKDSRQSIRLYVVYSIDYRIHVQTLYAPIQKNGFCC